MIITITHAEIVAAIQGSGSITKDHVTLTFNNCYEDNGKCYMKHDYTPGDDAYRYFSNYGSVKIESDVKIVKIEGFKGCSNKGSCGDTGSYEVSTNDITFYPSKSWIYGIKYNNLLHKFVFPEKMYIDSDGYCSHNTDTNVKNEKYLYNDSYNVRHITPKDNEKFRFIYDYNGLSSDNLYARFGYFITVEASNYAPVESLIKGLGYTKDIKGEVSLEDFKKYVKIYNESNNPISDYTVELLPVVQRTYDVEIGTNGLFYEEFDSCIGKENGGGNIHITIEDKTVIESSTIDSLEDAVFDSTNNRYEKVITAPYGTYFDKLIIHTYVDTKVVNVVANGEEYSNKFETKTTHEPNRLLKEVTSIVYTENPIVDVVANGEKGTSDYTLTTNHSTGRLIKSIKSKVNFENRTIDAISDATLSGSTYTKKTNPSSNKLINEVTTQVNVEDKTLIETDIINKNTITPTSGKLIKSVIIPELYQSYDITGTDLTTVEHIINTTKKLIYPLNMKLRKSTSPLRFYSDMISDTYTDIITINDNLIVDGVKIVLKSQELDINDNDIKIDPYSITPNKPYVITKVNINASTKTVKLKDIEDRDITFVEPRVPTIYYGIYIQLLKKFADNADRLLDDCECNCKHNNYNQKLISCWNLFHYACALYMEDSDSKMAQNIIKLVVSQLNLIYKEDEDFLISKYYIGKYENKTTDENEFNDISIFDLTPVEIDVCSEKEFNIELNHDTSVHYIMLPPDVELRKVWYNNCGIIQKLFDKEADINEYNSKLYKFSSFGNESGVIYWYYCSAPINNIQIECGKKK